MRNNDTRLASTKNTKNKHKMISKKEKINAVRGAIFPDATGILDLNAFS